MLPIYTSGGGTASIIPSYLASNKEQNWVIEKFCC
jgi:hypothetical protein